MEGLALPGRLAPRIREQGHLLDGDVVIVACSGGLDSCVLLHLLRFSPGLPRLDLRIAHFDHAMRPESGAQAQWVRGLGRAWGLPVTIDRAAHAPASEDAARRARYRFLAEVRAGAGARWILTAHHADDQAETVLFRVLRGTGISGLRGIPERGGGGLLRPLLPFWRGELEAYAERARVPFVTDRSNRDVRFARNFLRREILPRVEAGVAPGARAALVRLARLADEEDEAWARALPLLAERSLIEQGPNRIVISRTAFLAEPPGVRARLLRNAAGRLGRIPGDAGTRAALEFTSSGASGRRHFLPGGLTLAREFDRLVLSRPSAGPDGFVEIHGGASGEAEVELGGRAYRVTWTHSGSPAGPSGEAFATARIAFPLRLRGWLPGDRIRLGYGSKKLSKLFAEARIPASDRSRRPVLVDGRGAVLWVPGVARSSEAPEPKAEETLIIDVREIGSA